MKVRQSLLALCLLTLTIDKALAQAPGTPTPTDTPPATPTGKDGSRPPQVRTYSTVTVVDDPAKAPRLPTQKGATGQPQPANPPTPKEPLRTLTPTQLREGIVPAGRSEERDPRPAPPPGERRNLEALRQDLRATAKELREASKREPAHPPNTPMLQPPPRRPIELKTDPRPDKGPRAKRLERIGRDN